MKKQNVWEYLTNIRCLTYCTVLSRVKPSNIRFNLQNPASNSLTGLQAQRKINVSQIILRPYKSISINNEAVLPKRYRDKWRSP